MRIECLSRARRVLIWTSAILAFGGWGAAVLYWSVLGHPAGVHPGFILACSLAIAFTVVCAQSIVMPDQARLFALGVERGVTLQAEPAPPPRRLESVR